MLPQGIAHQCRTIPLGPACGLTGRLQQLLIEYDLNCFHLCRTYSTVYSTSVQRYPNFCFPSFVMDGSKGWNWHPEPILASAPFHEMQQGKDANPQHSHKVP